MKISALLLCAALWGIVPLQARAAPTELPVPILSWAGEPALDATVTLEAPRLTGSELAAAVAAQTKIELNLPPAIAAKTLVIRVKAMPLRELLPALGQLYGLEWTPGATPSNYSARVAVTPLELGYLQLGDLNGLRERQRLRAQEREREAALALSKGWNEAQLKEGVAFSALPAATGLALRDAKSSRSALNALSEWGQWNSFVWRSLRVHIAAPRATPPGAATGAPQLVLIDPLSQVLHNLGKAELPKP